MNNVINLVVSRRYAEVRSQWEKIKILDDSNQRKNFLCGKHTSHFFNGYGWKQFPSTHLMFIYLSYSSVIRNV